MIVPLVGRSSPTIIRAMVVLPEPDSPTMASDPASGMPNDTSSTATSGPNSLRRPATSSAAGPLASGTRSAGAVVSGIGDRLEFSAQLVRARAPGQPVADLQQIGHRGQADVAGVRAARRERALLLRCLERRQRPARDRPEPVRRLRDVRARS